MSMQLTNTRTDEMTGFISDPTVVNRFLKVPAPAKDHSEPFEGKIPSKWRKAAERNGFTIVRRVLDRLHVTLACHTCGSEHRKRISVVLGHAPECPHCIAHQRVMDARAVGARLLGRNLSDRHYGHYRLPCGHHARRQYHRVTRAAKGGHDLGCGPCREKRYAVQAAKCGWELIGPAANGKLGYRSYRHKCDQFQDIAVGNVFWGDCACSRCSPGRSASPSWIYIFRIDLPEHSVIKLGYSARPAKRLKHQLGICKTVNAEVVRAIRMPTGFDARTEEEQAHRFLAEQHPELIVPKSEFRNAINTQGEIYSPGAEALIHSLLDGIERRFPDTSF